MKKLKNGNVCFSYEDEKNGAGITITRITAYKVQSVEIKELCIPDIIDGKPVVEIGEKAASGLSHIEKLRIPDTVYAIRKSAFSGYRNLHDFNLPSSLQYLGDYAFAHAHIDGVFKMPPALKVIGKSAFLGRFYDNPSYQDWLERDCKIELFLNEGLKTIEAAAFQNKIIVNTVKIPKSVLSLSPTAFGGKRNGHGALQGKYIRDTNTKVEWYDEKGLHVACERDDRLPGWNKIPVRGCKSSSWYLGIDGAVYSYECINGTCIITNVASQTKYGNEECIVPSEIDGHPVVSLSANAFKSYASKGKRNDGTTRLQKVVLQEPLARIGKACFQKITSLKEVTLPESLTTIDTEAFFCTGIEEINIPKSVTEIGDMAFYACKELRSLCKGFPEGALTTLGINVFGNTKIREITIPSCVKTMGRSILGLRRDEYTIIIVRKDKNLVFDYEEVCYTRVANTWERGNLALRQYGELLSKAGNSLSLPDGITVTPYYNGAIAIKNDEVNYKSALVWVAEKECKEFLFIAHSESYANAISNLNTEIASALDAGEFIKDRETGEIYMIA